MEIQEDTGIVPKALESRPTIHPWLSFYITAFYDLAGSRRYAGMGSAVQIPVSEIASYCSLFEVTGLEEKEKFFRYMRAMDAAYLEANNERQEASDKSSKN